MSLLHIWVHGRSTRTMFGSGSHYLQAESVGDCVPMCIQQWTCQDDATTQRQPPGRLWRAGHLEGGVLVCGGPRPGEVRCAANPGHRAVGGLGGLWEPAVDRATVKGGISQALAMRGDRRRPLRERSTRWRVWETLVAMAH